MDLHEQVQISVGTGTPPVLIPDEFSVDAKIATVIEKVNGLGYRTYSSCQNYGEYLRELGFDFNHEAARDYAYIEFYELNDAIGFMREVMHRAGVTNPIYHKVVMEGTPDAWELKYRQTSEHFWLWLPESDILELEVILGAQI